MASPTPTLGWGDLCPSSPCPLVLLGEQVLVGGPKVFSAKDLSLQQEFLKGALVKPGLQEGAWEDQS